jgi:Nif-specific regulatory protein
MSVGAMALLTRYDWPGNVREMENLIERMVIMADNDEIDAGVLPAFLREREKEQNSEQAFSRIEEIERKEVIAALERNAWNMTRSARELGVTLRQIGYRVKKFGLDEIMEERKKKGQARGDF